MQIAAFCICKCKCELHESALSVLPILYYR
jgi:hypothetical protein